MAAYCTTADLLLGSIPLPSYIDAQKVVDDATDEIDSKLGHLYETPFDVSNGSDLVRPARLLLKRINSHLASGRLILAIASPEENSNLHAYGWQLVKEALTTLEALATGQYPLEGAVANPNAPTDSVSTPLIYNADAESNVEAFYDRIANPGYVFPDQLGRAYHSPDRIRF